MEFWEDFFGMNGPEACRGGLEGEGAEGPKPLVPFVPCDLSAFLSSAPSPVPKKSTFHSQGPLPSQGHILFLYHFSFLPLDHFSMKPPPGGLCSVCPLLFPRSHTHHTDHPGMEPQVALPESYDQSY